MFIFRIPGARAETSARGRGNDPNQSEGVSGLKALGVRDLSYRLAFLACSVKACNKKVTIILGGIIEIEEVSLAIRLFWLT